MGQLGGVQPGRHAGGHGVRGWHRAAVGRGPGKALVTLEGHTDRVKSAAFSPDGTRVVTASDDNTARLWDAASGKALATLEGHTDRSGRRCSARTARGWSRRPMTTPRGCGTRPRARRSSPWQATGLRSVGGVQPGRHAGRHGVADHTARLWDAATGKALATLEGHTGAVRSAAFSPDGTRVVTASDDKTARLWDAASGKALATLEGHTGEVMLGGVQPGRHAGGHGVLGSTPRGCGTRPRASRSPPWKATLLGLLGGVQPGRHAGGHGVGG